MKDQIAAQISEGVRRGLIHWQSESNMDRTMSYRDFAVRVRFVPTFAARHLLYLTTAKFGDCPLCEPARGDPAREWPPPMSRAASSLFGPRSHDGSTVSILNPFPYFDKQVTVFPSAHTSEFTAGSLERVLHLVKRMGLRAATLQVAGSGATIPAHAHLSAFDEPLPIFDTKWVALLRTSCLVCGSCPSLPILVLVFHGCDAAVTCRAICEVAAWANSQLLSYNALFDLRKSVVYLCLRTREYAPTIGRKIGAPVIGGVYLPYTEGSDEKAAAELADTIFRRYLRFDIETFERALVETCLDLRGFVTRAAGEACSEIIRKIAEAVSGLL